MRQVHKNLLFRIFLFGLIITNSQLRTPNSQLIYAQDLTVDGDLEINSPSATQRFGLIFKPPQSQPPTPASRGQIYYNTTDNQLYYYNGSSWNSFGGQDKNVATRIVAASNSLDTTRADYVCPIGGTTDQTEIQKAINDLSATGGVVYLLEGTYNISGAINLSSNTALIGTGRGTVLRVTSGSNLNVINASNVSGILISQLLIDGNNQGSNNKGIYFSSVTNSQIKAVWVENTKGDGISFNNSSSQNSILNSNIRGNSVDGIFLDSGSSYNQIINNQVRANANNGIHFMKNSSANIISGNNAQENTRDGIYLQGSDTNNNPSNNVISGNNVQLNGSAGIRLYRYCYNNSVTANNVSGNNTSGQQLAGICVFRVYGNNVSGNNVQLNKNHGIFVDPYANDNSISGNIIYENGESGNYDGIRVEGDPDPVGTTLISSNRIYDSTGTGYGINIVDADCEDTYLTGNLIDGAGFSRPINDLGTNTKYTDKIKLTFEPAAACSGAGCTGLAANQTLTPTGPTSYLRLAPTASITLNGTKAIEDGKSIGDLLILENTATNTVTIPDNANVRLSQTWTLGQDDTLTLFWNGADWIERHGSDN